MYAAFDRYITSIFNPDDEGLLTLIIFEYICLKPRGQFRRATKFETPKIL